MKIICSFTCRFANRKRLQSSSEFRTVFIQSLLSIFLIFHYFLDNILHRILALAKLFQCVLLQGTYTIRNISALRFRIDLIEICRIEVFRGGMSYLFDYFTNDNFDHNDCLQLFHAEVFYFPGV